MGKQLPPRVSPEEWARLRKMQQTAREIAPVPYWSTVRVAGTVAANTITVDTTARKGVPDDGAGKGEP